MGDQSIITIIITIIGIRCSRCSIGIGIIGRQPDHGRLLVGDTEGWCFSV
jgi:hypothetical protein